jgi:alpha-tubulin suppressor-like RCC1 family protein
VLEGGRVACWGARGNGRLSVGSLGPDGTSAPRPLLVEGVTDAVAVSAGEVHTGVLRREGSTLCFGANDRGQLGDGTTGRVTFPTPVLVKGLTGGERLALGNFHTCALAGSGVPRGWGAIGGLAPAPVAAVAKAVDLAAAREHACALTPEGALVCWRRSAPSVPDGLPPLTAVALGSDHVCVLDGAGALRCFGLNDRQQLGVEGLVRTVPSEGAPPVPGVGRATAVAAGDHHACALLADTTVVCWGDNEYGQLGRGQTGPPAGAAPVPGLTGVTELTAGGAHTCALPGDGRVLCWGWNFLGQLGDGSQQDRPSPTAVVW